MIRAISIGTITSRTGEIQEGEAIAEGKKRKHLPSPKTPLTKAQRQTIQQGRSNARVDGHPFLPDWHEARVMELQRRLAEGERLDGPGLPGEVELREGDGRA